MKRILLLFLLVAVKTGFAQTNPGDTIVVQTFTFGSPQDYWFVFPSDTMRYEKIIMKYTLKCNPAQSPACGEWDYLTNTYLYDHTGLTDSAIVVQPMLSVNGSNPDSIAYSATPTYAYDTLWQYFIVHSNTTSLNNSIVGNGNTTTTTAFGASQPVSKSQYLWKASEMLAAGVTAGNITGLQFFLQSLGGQLRNMTIRMQHTTLDSLTQATITTAGFTSVYMQNTTFTTTGWNSLQFTTPFNWDGVSNLLIEITYDNQAVTTDNIITADTTQAFKSALTNAVNDRTIKPNAGGYVAIPLNAEVAAIDSFITVAFWAYGDPGAQPMDGTCFEAVDSIGQRVINSHTPWSNTNVYWDAGNTGGTYDRINKLATTSETEGQWNYWAFTKNVATGSMKIYLNGNQWHSGTGMTRRMNTIRTFKLGRGNWGGSLSYAGRMDEFTVFNKELSAAEIQNYMQQPVTTTDPNYANLVLRYNFNDGNSVSVADSAVSGTHGDALLVNTTNPLKPAAELTTHFTESKIRPRVTFEQGVYTSYIDSMQVIDSLMNTPYQIFVYNDSINTPGVPTDTITGWPLNPNQVADSTIYADTYDYFNYFPQVIRYEMGRYITPYGNGLSLGAGWTWTYDVSDYKTLLHDSVHLAAGNWQELLDVKFLMIVGTPPRDVIGIANLYNGNFNYGIGSDPIDNYLPPLNVNIPANAVNSRWKSRVTGHGMDSPGNCAEFCPKNHFYNINNQLQYTKLVWRDNCDVNPLYPQGGTWVYDRSNWCPGAEVWTYDMELTPYVTPGSTNVLNHDVQAYVQTSGWDYYQIEDQIVYYSAPNFTLDASLDDIISPSKDQMWLRKNPICTNPIVKITNTGSTTLTSLVITYGLNNGPQSTFNWTGSLDFMESEEVTLGTFGWAQGASNFVVSISSPNGGTDQYPHNNNRISDYVYPPVMPATMVIEFKTNTYPWENSYTLKNSAGNVIHSRSGLSANTIYRDTLTLATDCYEFELLDNGEDGLSWWANSAQGAGYLRFRSATVNQILKSFGADFGGKIFQQFTVGLTSSTPDYILSDQLAMYVYPNPSNGMVNIDVNMTKRDNGVIEVYDVYGKKVYTHNYYNLTAESIEVDFSGLPKGVYFVTLNTGDQQVVRRLIMN